MDPKEKARWVFTVPEAGELCGLGRSASYEAARRGDLPVIKIGRKLLVPIEALRSMLEKAGQSDAEDQE